MGRKISVIDASLRTWYTPDIDDNRSDPDPFQVLISPLSGKDMRTLRSSLKLQATSLEAEEIMQAAERREDELRGLIVAQHVHDVRGYVAQDVTTGKVTEPKTGAELVECILSAHPDELIVLTDVYEAIMKASTLSEEAKKKQNSRSASPLAETPDVNHGDALNVADPILKDRIISGPNVIATAIPTFGDSVSSGPQS